MKKRHQCRAKWSQRIIFVFGLLLFAGTWFMLPVSPVIAGEPIKLSDPKCNCSVEKGKDGQEEFILTGQGCKPVAEGVKKAAKSQTKAYSGSNCVGMCECTWYDNLGKNGGFVCRGCCREILIKMQ